MKSDVVDAIIEIPYRSRNKFEIKNGKIKLDRVLYSAMTYPAEYGYIPNTLEDLMSLPGVGRKTANVVLSEGFKIQRIAVDTHVERVSKRLGVCDINSSVLDVEEELMKIVPSDNYHHAHHLLLFFGRYFCTAKKPQCFKCPFVKKCVKEDKNLQE